MIALTVPDEYGVAILSAILILGVPFMAWIVVTMQTATANNRLAAAELEHLATAREDHEARIRVLENDRRHR